jgi:hypothetical protein
VNSSIFCFAVDFSGGIDATLDDVTSLGVGGVALGVAYHAARDVLPHNAAARVHFSPPGIAFRTDRRRYPSLPAPHPLLPACDGRDLFAEVVAACAERGLATDAWAVYLHRDDEHPEPAFHVQNAFGDAYPHALCPAAPDARRYAETLTDEICAYGPRFLVAEAMHFLPLLHGAHHERYFAPLEPLAQFLLALCFCGHCTEAAEATDIDVRRLRAWVKAAADGPSGSSDPCVAELAEQLAAETLGTDDFQRFLDLRERHVSSIVSTTADAARRHGVRFCFIDPAPALAPPSTTDARLRSLDDCSRQLGVALRDISAVCDVAPALYVADAAAFADDLAASTDRVGKAPAAALLRPMLPDSETIENLSGKTALLADRGVETVFYYHYGLMRESDLARLRAG